MWSRVHEAWHELSWVLAFPPCNLAIRSLSGPQALFWNLCSLGLHDSCILHACKSSSMWATPSLCYLGIQPGCFYPWLQWSWTSWLHDWRQHLPMLSFPAQCSRSSLQVLSFQMMFFKWTCIVQPIAVSGRGLSFKELFLLPSAKCTDSLWRHNSV